jgi:hypothetical protein
MKAIVLFIQVMILSVILGSCSKDDRDLHIISYGSDLINPSLEMLREFHESGYNTVEGDIVLDSVSGLENMLYFSNLHTIAGDLLIRGNNSLSSLEGMHRLKAVTGDLVIMDCDQLLQVGYIGFLNTVSGNLRIEGNENLFRIAMPGLDKVDGDVYLGGQEYLTFQLDFSSLQKISGSLILAGTFLPDMTGFSHIREIGHNLILDGNELIALAGLESLEFVEGRAEITDNPELVDLCGIRNLLSRGTGGLQVVIDGNAYNPSVQDIQAGNCSP